MRRFWQLTRYYSVRYARAFVRPICHAWKPFSHLMIWRDYSGWTLDIEAQAVAWISRRIGVPVAPAVWMDTCRQQGVYVVDQFVLLNPPDWRDHHVALAYYHGKPGLGVPEFDQIYSALKRDHGRIDRIQVTNTAMKGLLSEAGVDPAKIRVIPIGFDSTRFCPPTVTERQKVRRKLGIPDGAFVIGSFQKDGVGWGKGTDPKWIKGPDILVKVLRAVRDQVGDVFVLLTGPGREYVKKGLNSAGVPFRHIELRRYLDIVPMYHALDAYLVTSREEGGPKAVLESMATGVSLITTRVGQAADLVRHGHNGCMVEIDDVEGLIYWTVKVHQDSDLKARLVRGGAQTASQHSYRAQIPLWRDFFDGIVSVPGNSRCA